MILFIGCSLFIGFLLYLGLVVNTLRLRLSVLEIDIAKLEVANKFTPDQVVKLQDHFTDALVQSVSKFEDKFKLEFEDKLKSNFEEACEKINFEEIQYKKTITKRRKEYTRNAKPQRIWRYIDAE